jgi:hypothetical protein
MRQNTFFMFLYFLSFYQNDAFYKPFTPSFSHKKKNDFYLLNSRNKENNNNKNDDSELYPTKTFRLGRSKDQDGKGNVWSVEPKMEVVDEELTEVNKNILTSGLIITGFLATLPLLYTLNQYIKNIDY